MDYKQNTQKVHKGITKWGEGDRVMERRCYEGEEILNESDWTTDRGCAIYRLLLPVVELNQQMMIIDVIWQLY